MITLALVPKGVRLLAAVGLAILAVSIVYAGMTAAGFA
jgi:hypothetical protein